MAKINVKQIQLGGNTLKNGSAYYPDNLQSILKKYQLWVNNNESDPAIFGIGEDGNIVRFGGAGGDYWQLTKPPEEDPEETEDNSEEPFVPKLITPYPIEVSSATVSGFNVEKFLSLIEYQYEDAGSKEFPLSAGIVYSDGNFSDSSSYTCTDFIPVKAGEILSFSTYAAINVYAISAYADSAQDSIILDSPASILGNAQLAAYKVTIPVGVNYVRICNDTENNNIENVSVFVNADNAERSVKAVGFKVDLYSNKAISALGIGRDGETPAPAGGYLYSLGDVDPTVQAAPAGSALVMGEDGKWTYGGGGSGGDINLSFVSSGTGNVVTDIVKAGNTVTFTKGITISSWALAAFKPSYAFSEITGKPTTLEGYGITDGLTSASLANYVTLNTAQTITGQKTFTARPIVDQGTATNPGINLHKGGVTKGSLSYTSVFNATVLYNTASDSLIGVDDTSTPIYAKGSTKYTIWHAGNFNPGNYATTAWVNSMLDTKLDKSVFDDLFEKVNIGTSASPIWSIKAKYGLWTEQFLTAVGVGSGNGGSGGGIIQTVYGYGDLGGTFSNTNLTDTFNAYTINAIYTALQSLQNNAPISFVSSGTGNVVTDIVKAGNTVTFTKGITALTTADLANYVTLNTEQTITGNKTFTKEVTLSNNIQITGRDTNGVVHNLLHVDTGNVSVIGTINRVTRIHGSNILYQDAKGVNNTLWHSGNFTPGNYVTSASLSSTLASYVTNSSLSSTLASYVTSTSLSNTLASYATQSWVSNMLSYYVDTIIIGNQTAYSPTNGRIYLPAYPTVPDVPAWALAANKPSYAFSEITGKPTTISGYGITDGVTNTSLASTLASYVTSTSLSNTLASYATRSWVSTQLAGYLPLTGGTLTGNLAINAKLSVTDTTSAGGSSDSIYTAGGIYTAKNVIAAGAITALATGTSDIRLKRDIKTLNGLSTMRKIGKAFLHHWNEKALSLNACLSNEHYNPSWSAQDVKSVFPVASIDGLYGGKYLGINREALLPLTWNAVIEVDDKVTKLQKRVKELEKEISIMKGERYAS